MLIFHGKLSRSEYFFYRLLSFLLQPKEEGNRGQFLTGSGDICECHNPQPSGGHTVTKMMCSGPPEPTVREDIGGRDCWREFIFLPSLTLIPLCEDLNKTKIQLISERSDRPCKDKKVSMASKNRKQSQKIRVIHATE